MVMTLEQESLFRHLVAVGIVQDKAKAFVLQSELVAWAEVKQCLDSIDRLTGRLVEIVEGDDLEEDDGAEVAVEEPFLPSNAGGVRMICPTCGERLDGDGYQVVLHCPSIDVVGAGFEPDSTPMFCQSDGVDLECTARPFVQNYR